MLPDDEQNIEMTNVARSEQQSHVQAENASVSPAVVRNTSDEQPVESASTSAATSPHRLAQVNEHSLAALQLHSSPDEVPSDVADSSPFPTTLRRTSTATVGAIGLQTIEEKPQSPRRASNAPSFRETSLVRAPEVWSGSEPHYGLLQSSVRSVLEEILTEMATSTSLHTWDQKLFVSPLGALEKAVRQLLTERPDLDMTSILTGTAVEAIASNRRSTVRKSPLHGDVPHMLFFTRVSSLLHLETQYSYFP